MQVVENDFFVLFVYFFLFSEDDFSFSFYSGFFEFGVLEDVGDDFYAGGGVLLKAAGIVDGLFTGSVGIEMGSHVFDFKF